MKSVNMYAMKGPVVLLVVINQYKTEVVYKKKKIFIDIYSIVIYLHYLI